MRRRRVAALLAAVLMGVPWLSSCTDSTHVDATGNRPTGAASTAPSNGSTAPPNTPATSDSSVDNTAGTGGSNASAAPGSATGAATTPTVTPATEPGMLSGPGVTGTSITLGLIAPNAATDMGFRDGLRLWSDAVNAEGGICERTVTVRSVFGSPEVVYRSIGRDVLGLITVGTPELTALISADRIPTLTPEGTSSVIAVRTGPVVLGAPESVLAVNTASYLLRRNVIRSGGSLGVVVDDSADGQDALAGLRWWAPRHQVQLREYAPGQRPDAGVPAVYAAGSADQVAELLRQTANGGPAAVTSTAAAATLAGVNTAAGPVIATSLDAFQLGALPQEQLDRLLVATVTPAATAEHPGANAVTAAFRDAFGTERPLGARTLEGYATGQFWGRTLTAMCTEQNLTRSAATRILASQSAASPDSLYGPTDSAAQLNQGQPASRVSAVSVADPRAASGLRALTLLESAPDIAALRIG